MCGRGEVGVVEGVGVCMENPTPVQRLYHVIFVHSVIFCHSLCGLLNKLEGVGRGCWCGCGEVSVGRWVCGGGCGEEGVGRLVWGGGCVEVGVGRWVWGG